MELYAIARVATQNWFCFVQQLGIKLENKNYYG